MSRFVVSAMVEGGGLTNDVLDAAAENEIWYADKLKPENLEEGRFVRQMMTRDILGSMMHVHGVRLLFLPVSDLQMEVSLYVEDYIEHDLRHVGRVWCRRTGVGSYVDRPSNPARRLT